MDAQTVIFNETFNEVNGATSGQDANFENWNVNCPTCDDYYEVRSGALEQRDSDGPATFRTDNIDVSNCNTLTFSMSYSGGPWSGSGNFEGADECPPCAGDTNTPLAGGCSTCWDFTLVELVFNDGTREEVEFIGTNSNDVIPSMITWSGPCLGNKTTARIEIKSQTWQDDEITRYDNIMLVCNDPPADILVDQDPLGVPFCVGDQVELMATNIINENFEWFDPNGNPIGNNSNSISFAASGSFGIGSQIFSVISTDGMGCKSRGQWGILVRPSPIANILPSEILLCEGEDFTLNEIGSGGIDWDWDGPVTGAGNSSLWTVTDAEPNATGTYSVTVTDVNGCTDTDIVNITVEPGGAYMIDAFKQFCTSEPSFTLSTTQDMIPGDWSGPGVTANVFDPSTLTGGNYELTFTPTTTGCALPMMANVMVNDAPLSFPPSGTVDACGSQTAVFDLTVEDDNINGGSGLPVSWFEDAGLTIPIPDPTSFDAASSTVYAVIVDVPCFSSVQELDLVMVSGPEIMMAGQISGCGSLTLNNINILNDSGNQAYYDQPGGMGNVIPVGTEFTSDTIVYAFDSNGTCTDEQMILVSVGGASEPGPDTTITLCASGFVDLLDLLSPSADVGSFQDIVGNPIIDNMIFADDFFATPIQLIYQTNSVGACPPETAIYTISAAPANDAGADSLGVVCRGQVLTASSFTFDDGASGSLEYLDGSSVPDDLEIYWINDVSPFEEFNYIVNSSAVCDPDTSYIRIQGENGPFTTITGSVCFDYSIDVNGTTYNQINPIGQETISTGGACDSLIDINLDFRPENRILLDQTLCVGQDITVNQVVYNEANSSGTEILENADQFACDSIVDISLSFDNEIVTLIDFRLCTGEDTIINGEFYDENNLTGSAMFSSSSGCDSIVMVDLEFGAGSTGELTGVFCPSDTLIVDGEVFDINRPEGMVQAPNLNAAGCDSSTLISMDFDMSFSRDFDFDLCEDETIMINGRPYGASNPQGMEVVSNSDMCDSLFNINLNILNVDTSYIFESFCMDTSITVNNVVYDRFNFEGMEVIEGGSATGCREYVYIELEFIESFNEEVNEELCLADSLIVNGVRYDVDNSSGIETLTSSNGCDSVIIVELAFVGIQANVNAVNPNCNNEEGGLLEIEILADENFLSDILLDGNSILSQYQSGALIDGISSGSHEVIFVDERACNLSRTFVIEDVGVGELNISANNVNDNYYQLLADFTSTYTNISWTPSDGLSCTDCPNPEARPEINTTYYLEIEDAGGCIFSDSISLDFLVNGLLFSPNIFSPNEDGVNDMFFIDSEENFTFRNFMIYDRWGNNVFRNPSGNTGVMEDGWDGQGYTQGVYVFHLEVEFPSGFQTFSGEVSLFR